MATPARARSVATRTGRRARAIRGKVELSIGLQPRTACAGGPSLCRPRRRQPPGTPAGVGRDASDLDVVEAPAVQVGSLVEVRLGVLRVGGSIRLVRGEPLRRRPPEAVEEVGLSLIHISEPTRLLSIS